VYHPKVGIPQLSVSDSNGDAETEHVDALGADQLTTLIDATNRFVVVERAQLDQLLKEQHLVAKSGQVKGVDYLVLAKVTNLRVKKTSTSNNFGAGDIGGLINLGGASVSNSKTEVTTECGVDIRLVNPSTGVVAVSSFSEFKRTDSAKSMGVEILGADASSNADVQVDDDDKGKILRLALDDAIRKSLPKLDNFLAGPQNTAAAN
jgi:curli biogenesis system outer membrane secretion channel CsgG